MDRSGHCPWLPTIVVISFWLVSPTAQAIDDASRDALLRGDEIVIFLDLVPPPPAGVLSSDGSQNEKVQDNVLSRLPAGEYQLRYKYKYSPTLAVSIDSLDTLEIIESLFEVRAVYADAKGKGEMEQSRAHIRANEVSDLGLFGFGATVAVIDSGVDTDHPDFTNGQDDSRIIHEKSFLDAGTIGESAEDENGHGTNVTGIIASRGMVSQPGLAPDVNIVAIKVLDQNNEGWISDWTAALEHVIELHVAPNGIRIDVLNLSVASNATFVGICVDAYPAFATACKKARSLGIMLVASAGNRGSVTEWPLPACYESVFSVASSGDESDNLSVFSNHNEFVDFVAPGQGITSSGIDGETSSYSGTSQACPHVAGLACLMRQIQRDMSPEEIRTRIQRTGRPVTDLQTGRIFLRIDALDAVEELLNDEDCDGSMSSDVIDIILGRAKDCNENRIPDSCDIDSGESQDCNLSGIPDECEIEQAFHFAAADEVIVGGEPTHILAANLDQEEGEELVTMLASGQILLLRKDDGQTFELYGFLGLTDKPVDIAISDLNSDRLLDLIVAQSDDPHLSIFLGRGGGQFAPEWKQGLSQSPTHMTVARLDGDDFEDVALSSASGVEILLGNGDGTFIPHEGVPLDEMPLDIIHADLDGDDDNDLVVALRERYLLVLEAGGEGSFQLGERIDVGRQARFIEAADFNHDGNIDLLAANAEGHDIILISNRGESGFGISAILRVGNQLSSAIFADLDLDRSLDLVVTSQEPGIVSIFRGNGRGFFRLEQAIDADIAPGGVATIKRVGEGNSALAVSGRTSNAVSIIANESRFEGSSDCDRDGVPDECKLDLETDRNDDGILDVCQTELTFFNRGDTNADGSADLSDGIFIFEFLFLGGPRSNCEEGSDVNHDGRIDISDGMYLLRFLFMGGSPPMNPGPPGQLCGLDSDPPGSPTDLGCNEYEPCN